MTVVTLWKRAMVLVLPLLLATGLGASCQTAYYNFWETFGKQKRDLLVDNIEEANSDQKAVRDEFKDALTRLRELYGTPETDLAKVYDSVKASYDNAAAKAERLSSRLDRVERIADDLFDEWKGEAKTIQNPKFRSDSLKKLASTKANFQKMDQAMRASEKRIGPVLTQLRDHVLYLKHNLNAQAIGSLHGEYGDIKKEIEALIGDIQASVERSDAFIKSMR